MAKRLRQRVGELMRQHDLTYSKFSRKSGVSMGTSRALYEDPYHNLTGNTLLTCAEFFGVDARDLVIEEEEENPTNICVIDSGVVKIPAETELLSKLFASIFPDSLIEQVKRVAPRGLVAFIYEAIAEKLERESDARSLDHSELEVSNERLFSSRVVRC